MRRIACCLMSSLAVVVTGCATLTKGTSQTVTVNTDPTGATCTMTRDDKPVAVVSLTPGSIPVEKANGSIAILCKKQGYLDAVGQLASEFQPMTFGNILFGGLVGVVVDAASGAMHRYPETVTITLIPEEFESDQERDAFFDKMRASLEREAAEAKDRISKLCRAENCSKEQAAADASADTKRAEIEQHRTLARVKAE